MLNNYMSLLTINNPLDDMKSLTKNRNYSCLPVGGRYKLIDFALSNLVNSGVSNIGILGNLKNSSSLMEHIGSGAPWDLDRKNDGIFFLTKYLNSFDSNTLSDLETNIKYLAKSKQKNVILINPGMVYNMDLKEVIKEHESDARDVTIVYKNIENSTSSFYQATTLVFDELGTLAEVGKNIHFNNNLNISTDVMIISKAKLVKLIGTQIEKANYGALTDLILDNLTSLTIKGFEFKGYLAQINSVKDYYDFNMTLLKPEVKKELFNKERPIYTKRKDTPSTLYNETGHVENSLISNGCQISGLVKNSILGRRVIVDEGVVIENCIINRNCHIKVGAVLRCVIIDKEHTIAEHEYLHSSPSYPLVVEEDKRLSRKVWDELIRGEDNE